MIDPSPTPNLSDPASTRRTFVRGALAGVGAVIGAAPALALVQGPAPSQDPLRFLEAVRTGNLESVKALLTGEPELLSAKDSLGRSAFALATLGGHGNIAGLLLERGHAPDVHEAALALDWERLAVLAEENPAALQQGHPIGGTPMYCAALGGAGYDIWRVYSAGAWPNLIPGGSTPSPLEAALSFRDLVTAELTAATLLSNGASARGTKDAQASPLHLAAHRGSTAAVESLIRHGADVGARDHAGATALDLARKAGHGGVVKLLSDPSVIPRTHSTSRTAFDGNGAAYTAPNLDDIPIQERIRFVGLCHRSLGAVKKRAAEEPRLVHAAATTTEICVEAGAHMGRRPVVEFLVEQGAPYSLPTAVMSGDKKRVLELLDADPKRIHERGAHDFALLWYPLIGRCEIDMLETLMARGAKIEQQHLLGTTALHWACRSGAIDVADFLIEKGADLERVGRKFDPAGQTPLECAIRAKRSKVADLLRARGAKGVPGTKR